MEKKLLERAKEFLINSEFNIKKGFYSLAIFNLEQALQLLIKYVLLSKIGYFSKTHSLVELKEELKEVNKEFAKFLEENEEILLELERAYIGARYLGFEYTEKEAKKYLKFVKECFNFVK